MSERKLGKKPFHADTRDLKLERYLTDELPTAPARFGFGRLYPEWGMLGNGPDDTVKPGFDGAGDCVFASAAHQTMIWNKVRHGHDVAFDGKSVIADYSAVTGYVIGDESTDQGTEIREALKYRKATGVRDKTGARHKIVGYVQFEATNWEHLVRGAYVFGAIEIGFQFPASAFDQLDAGEIWDVVDGDDGGILGGHDICIVGSMNSKDRCTCVTWGQRQELTRDFYESYNDEAWGIVTAELIREDGEGIHGFDLDTFKHDLSLL